jgi:hypothetical protein
VGWATKTITAHKQMVQCTTPQFICFTVPESTAAFASRGISLKTSLNTMA